MRGYFSYQWEANQDTDKVKKFHVLFKSPGILSVGDLSDAIESAVATILFPDVIAIVCPKEELEEVREQFRKDEALIQAANRTSNKISLCFCTYDKKGEIRYSSFERNPADEIKTLITEKSNDLIQAGIRHLFDDCHVLVTAPPGFIFVKPSGEKSTSFIRTEEALTEIESVQFLSFALLGKVLKREKKLRAPIQAIYIDSMSIASVAYALRDMYCSLYECARPRVVSFHSHQGLDELEKPLPGTSFCLISASASLGLEKKWKELTKCDDTEVVTILSVEKHVNPGEPLYCLPEIIPKVIASGTTEILTDLRMFGERFSPEELKPKQVLLKSKEHFEKEASDFSELFTGGRQISVMGKGNEPLSKRRSIHIDSEILEKNSKFLTYLGDILRAQKNCQAVIHQDDAASENLAKYCALQFQKIFGEELLVISQASLESRTEKFDGKLSLLVVAMVAGRGSKLLSISRDLRSIHLGARVYLIGAQVAQTKAQVKTLARNLKFSSTKASIDVKVFSVAAIGNGAAESFLREDGLFKVIPAESLGSHLELRRSALASNNEGLFENVFFPIGPDLDQYMALRPDFAMWKFRYDENACNVPSLYLTVASILQRAREEKFDNRDNHLSTEAFQQVILDPENFARYNDGVIQASILRAAHDAELDYSSHQTASLYMLDFLHKVFAQHERAQGEASLEFAYAIWSGRLKLVKEHSEELISRVSETVSNNTIQKIALRTFLGIAELSSEKQFPKGF